MTRRRTTVIEDVPTYIVPPVYGPLRLTVPAREALIRAGNSVSVATDVYVDPDPEALDPRRPPSLQRSRAQTWHVQLVRAPRGIERVWILSYGQYAGLRLRDEPAYPGEISAAWWERGEWTPCPRCGLALVWYEAGYVPGYRICLAGHHAQLSDDGRSTLRRRA